MATIALARGWPAPECLPPADVIADCARDGARARRADDPLVRPVAPATARCASGSRSVTASLPAAIFLTNGSLQGFVFLAQMLAPGRAGAGRAADVRPAAEDPPRARRRRRRRWTATTTASIRTRSSARSPPARRRRSPTCFRPSRTRAGARCPSSAAGASPSLRSEHGLLVLEDDPYGLVRFEGEPPAAALRPVGRRHGIQLVVLEDGGAGAARRLVRSAGGDRGAARGARRPRPTSRPFCSVRRRSSS